MHLLPLVCLSRGLGDVYKRQQERVKTFSEGQSFEELQKKIDSFVSLVEEDSSVNDEEINENETVDDADFIKEDVKPETILENEEPAEDKKISSANNWL